jgi:hypothetical protein
LFFAASPSANFFSPGKRQSGWSSPIMDECQI